jgi:hypothetical protein
MQYPGARAAWRALSGSFNPGLTEFVNGLLATRSVSGGYLLSSARWKSDLAHERELASSDVA